MNIMIYMLNVLISQTMIYIFGSKIDETSMIVTIQEMTRK